MPFFDDALRALPEYQALRSAAERFSLPAGVTGVSHIHKTHLIHTLCCDTGSRALIVVSDEGEAERLREDLTQLGDKALIFPARDFTLRAVESISREYEHARLGVLAQMLEGEYNQVICCVDALSQFILPPDQLLHHTFWIKAGQEISPAELCSRLTGASYVRADQVEGPGQYSLRGGILDFFTPCLPQPVRAEFWGDEIDSLACFDPLTQRRVDTLKTVRVTPAAEVVFDQPETLANRLETLVKQYKGDQERVRTQLLEDAHRLREGLHVNGPDRYLPLLHKHPSTLFQYAEDAYVFVSEPSKVKEKNRVFHWQHEQDLEALFEQGHLCAGLDRFMLTAGEMTGEFASRGAIYLDAFAHSGYDTPIKELVSLNARQSSPWQGGVAQLMEDVSPLLERGYACAVLAGGQKAASVLADDLRSQGLRAEFAKDPSSCPAGTVWVTTGRLSAGLEYPEAKFALFTCARSEGQVKRKKRGKRAGDAIHSLDELHRGDYVVHSAHGIGIFEGIQKLEVQGVTKDYIRISYAGSDALYVPVTQLDMVSKYIGPSGDDVRVKLHRLGGTEWQKTKTRVRKAVKDLAKGLIALYSERMHTAGYAFSPDTDLQNDFERRFEFEETDDQLRCIDEIKYDMERPVPMDRLLCGDVGFGKTEVALRAAFKCISEGKQCVLLVPTTILAWQHYQTILRRMEGLPVTIELLNRFRSPKQQEETLRHLRSGEADMVVGTHRLLSKDVQFHDLGLVIIDEEQRFGVAQKEKLKELFKSVDVLTLSATPIPRTLNMAMSGLRDMSVIEEAPHDRHPVQTYVLEYDAGVLADAIRRELRRGGQVYYLHNRVESIERIAARLAQRVPEANIGIAHGKMSEDELSDIWRKLLEQEIDVLVCTTIIETGVDVPNCNTLIIENADCMGLSQLHQLRGRVGRSSRRAYAYLTFRPGKALSDTATRRLEAVREFTEFGSGLKIAMRDLEIRGAGNLLGGEQHGQMESVGYDMYLKMLADAVGEEKGETVTADPECMVDLQVPAHIPEDYIPALQQRLGVYRRIADIRTQDDQFDVTDELIDRFGEPPAAVKGLIDVALLRNMAAALGIHEVTQKENSLLLYPNRLDMELCGALASALRGRVMVNAGNTPYIAFKMLKGQKPIDALREVLTCAQASANAPAASEE